MLAGHLQEKNGKYYAVLNCKHHDGSRFPKWIATNLPVKGNKKRAEQMLNEFKTNYTIYGELISNTETTFEAEEYTQSPLPTNNPAVEKISNACDTEDIVQTDDNDGVLFSDYMRSWLYSIESEVDPVTYSGYYASVEEVIAPYFDEKKIKLHELTSKDLKEFYKYERQGDAKKKKKPKKGTTVTRYHANIHSALETAVEDGLVARNVSHKMRPGSDKFIGSFYLADEANELMKVAEGTKLELAVMFGLFYGLRRSEIIGLKWQNFDFTNNIFTISHTVTSFRGIDGKVVQYAKNKTKNQSSLRSLPLIPLFQKKLLALREKQKEDRRVCGKSYSRKYQDYVYVDDMGELIKPDYISSAFPILLRQHGLRSIRFHDTRHSCASLLLKNGVSMKEIQAWLGHSDYSTTANLYAHLDVETSKFTAAQRLTEGLGL